MHYTLAIKRRFLPLWKKYQVTQHWCESSDLGLDNLPLNFEMRMCLRLKDKSVLVLPNIASRTWRLYPDYEPFMAEIRNLQQAVAVEQARLAEDQ